MTILAAEIRSDTRKFASHQKIFRLSLEVDHVQGTTFRIAFKDAAAGAISL
jgi:hypothetical protein